MASRLLQTCMSNRRIVPVSLMSMQRMHLMQTMPILGAPNGMLRQFSNQVEKQDDNAEDVHQQVDNESGVTDAASEDASEPPIGQGTGPKDVHQMYSRRYGAIKRRYLPERISSMNPDTFEEEMDKLEAAFVNACGGLTDQQLKIVLKNKPSAFFFEEDFEKTQTGLKAMVSVFHEQLGIELSRVTDLMVRYPAHLSKSVDELKEYLSVMEQYGVDNQEAFELLEECPRLISQKHADKIKEQLFFFDLYHKMPQHKYMKIVKGFPYVLCLDQKKLVAFLGQFKKYRFTHHEIIKVATESGGLMASKVSNLIGVFEQLRLMGINAKQTRQILTTLPEFALQNRKDLLRTKVNMIQRESGRDDIYMRNFVKRHPDIVMK